MLPERYWLKPGFWVWGLMGLIFLLMVRKRKAHVRLCDPDTPIRANSPIESPHILAIFHEALIKTVPVLQGVEPDATVLLNTTKTTTQAREYLKLHGGFLGCVDALNIAIEENSRVNIPMRSEE